MQDMPANSHFRCDFLTGLLTLRITMLTIGYHTLKAARTNPVEALRC